MSLASTFEEQKWRRPRNEAMSHLLPLQLLFVVVVGLKECLASQNQPPPVWTTFGIREGRRGVESAQEGRGGGACTGGERG